jgi:hypothetical protein
MVGGIYRWDWPKKAEGPWSRAETTLIIVASLLVVVCMMGAGVWILALADDLPPRYGKVASHFGSFLLISSTSALIYRVLFRPKLQEMQNRRIMDLFQKELDRLVPKVFTFGLKNIESRMKYSDLFDSLQSGDELWWLDTYAPGYQSWRANLRSALARGARVKMLVLEPGCRSAKLRANEIAPDLRPDAFHSDLKQFHDDMIARARASQNRAIDVRIYNDLIGCPIYLIERNGRAVNAFSSLYLNPASFDFPHFEWEESTQRQILDGLQKYVKYKWIKARSPLEGGDNPR